MKIRQATYEPDRIKEKYDNFAFPVVRVMVNDKDVCENTGLAISDVEIELSSGYEASTATFVIYNSFDRNSSEFLIKETRNFIMLGQKVEIAVGYSGKTTLVFKGFLSRVNFFYPEADIPGIRITAMDVKGIMMANSHSRQLTATCYSDAVREILSSGIYQSLGYNDIYDRNLSIEDTPDKSEQGTADKKSVRTIEFVGESDYEFIVKAAKKYNYEFFVLCGRVIFRKAKSDDEILTVLTPKGGLIKTVDVQYDMTGLIETVSARGMDAGSGKLIKASAKASNKISQGGRAKSYIRGTEKVYIDPTITSVSEAQSRAQSLMEDISYRYGTLECTLIGFPELKPGCFISLSGLGEPLENDFYIVSVTHILDGSGPFETRITAKAATIGGNQ